MANNNSTKKRVRQAEKSRIKNSQIKTSVRSASKKLLLMIKSKSETSTEELQEAHNSFIKKIDNAAKHNIYHWKKAARLKSRMAQKVNSSAK